MKRLLTNPYPKPPKRNIRMLSWGVGRQSTAAMVMSLHGDLPPLDGAIFCDLEAERKSTYENLRFYTAYAASMGLPVFILYPGNIMEDILIARTVRLDAVPLR